MLFPIFVCEGKSRTRFKVGYINRDGQTVIEPVFDEGTRFYEGLASVKVKGGRWGVIDTSGDFAISPKFYNPCVFHEGLASLATRYGKYGAIDHAGNFVIEPRYDSIGPFQEGLALVRVGESKLARYGFVDKFGTEVIPPQFQFARGFSEGLAAARVGDFWGYINSSGDFQIPPRFNGSRFGSRFPGDLIPGHFVDGLAPVWSSFTDFRFIDKGGESAFDCGFEEAKSFHEGYAMVKRDNRFGFIDTNGQAIVECKFARAQEFSEGLAMVRVYDDQVDFPSPSGFIDNEGRQIIEPRFYSADSFWGGLSLVTTKDEIGYINRSGKFVWQGPFVDSGVLL